MKQASLGWTGIARLGLVQTALGAIVVLTTSIMNRVMVVELALPAVIPGALVGLHYAIQLLRPKFGFGSDLGGRSTPWIVGGIATLGIGAVLAAAAIALEPSTHAGALALATIAFLLVGAGVGAAGTSLLVLLAKRVDPARRAAAATTVWLMMIAGFVATTIIVGKLLDPYTASRLVAITAAVAVIALAVTLAAVAGLEPAGAIAERPTASADESRFMPALRQIWREPEARLFTVFVFVSMLAYSGQDLILEPFAGSVFGMTPGQSTQLSGAQHGGVLVGMIVINLLCAVSRGSRLASLRVWTVAGCAASALALFALTVGGWLAPAWPLRANVFLLGVANGMFAVAAIGSMMSLAGHGREQREGTRMGLWGAAQAIAFGLGGFLGAAGSDVARHFVASAGHAYGIVFAAEALLFLIAARIAIGIGARSTARTQRPIATPGVHALEAST